MSEYKAQENEKLFKLEPVGVAYVCEFCHEGEMEGFIDEPLEVDANGNMPLIPHRCNKCGKVLQLPRMYPRIEWNRVESKPEKARSTKKK